MSARQRRAKERLTEVVIRAVLRATLPRRNEFGPIHYRELLDECTRFGIRNRGQFRRLMLRHRRQLIEADREPLDAIHQRIFRGELGDATYRDLIRRQIWFSWEALTRLALELEFKDAYRRFANERDGLPADHRVSE